MAVLLNVLLAAAYLLAAFGALIVALVVYEWFFWPKAKP